MDDAAVSVEYLFFDAWKAGFVGINFVQNTLVFVYRVGKVLKRNRSEKHSGVVFEVVGRSQLHFFVYIPVLWRWVQDAHVLTNRWRKPRDGQE